MQGGVGSDDRLLSYGPVLRRSWHDVGGLACAFPSKRSAVVLGGVQVVSKHKYKVGIKKGKKELTADLSSG